MLAKQWLKSFVITAADVDDITSFLLEKERPMVTRDLALYVIGRHLEQERTTFQDRFKVARLYNPGSSFEIGEQLLFSKFNLALGKVTASRKGSNPQLGEFDVITVHLEDSGETRDFAASLKAEHALSQNPQGELGEVLTNLTPQEIMDSATLDVTRQMLEALHANKELKQVAGYWFPKDLVLDIDVGTLHLAEAVLDMNNGGPLNTEQIIEQVGGLGDAAPTLQAFSLNLAMSQDRRFDEVGPAGRILWFLKRMEPNVVQKIPELLAYRPIEYDDDLLDDEMVDLETELDDELTDIDFVGKVSRVTTKLIYPHRRVGSLPLNAKTRQIFPTARTPLISITIVDHSDDERFSAWVVHEHKFIYGLADYYAKHHLPVGALITVQRGENEGEFILSFASHKARVEYIPIFQPHTDHIGFENGRRSIGAEYDPLLVLGVDDLAAIDTLTKFYQNKSLVTILRALITALSRLSPQQTVHFSTLYSAVNVLRRCPPGPIFALLQANAEFEDVGDYYWRLSRNERS